ncbi:MAG: hypothetical protein ACRYGP_02730 [Janthinobacterium lividum]
MPTHHLLPDFVLDTTKLGPSGGYARTAAGQGIFDVLTSTEPFAALIGAIDAASSRPPQPALDRYLLPAIGIEAASDPAKIFIGRVVRQLVEHIGGHWVRSGVAVTEPSIFANGSIYSLPGRDRGKLSAPERRLWAEEQIVLLKGHKKPVDGTKTDK